MTAATEPMRKRSRRRPDTPAMAAPRSTAWRRLAFFFPEPGRRLISIIGGASAVAKSGSCDLPERQTDGQHQQRSNLVSDERFERAVTHLQVRQRVGLLHREA